MPLIAAKPFRVLNLNCNWRTECASVAHSAHQCDDVFLKTLTRASAISETTTSKVSFNVFSEDRHARRKAFNDDRESFSV
jgi:hypothetical protein